MVLALVNIYGAEFSHDTMTTVVDRSETSDVLCKLLLNCKDLPPDLMHNMFWWVGAELKKHILTTAHVDEAVVNEMLADAQRGMAAQVEEAEDQLNRVERTVRRRMRLGQLNQDALVQYLRRGQVAEFIAALGYLTEVDQKTARRIVFTPGHEVVAVACRAKGFDLSTFSTIVLLLADATEGGAEDGVEKQLRRPEEVADLLELYKQVPIETAKRAMRFWAIRQQSVNETTATT